MSDSGTGKATPPDERWSLALPYHLPRPTSSPALCAAGVVLVMWSFLGWPVLAPFGGALFAASLAIWIREIVHERRTQHPPSP